MIPLLLRDLLPRLALVAVIALGLYLLEPAFHQHGPVPEEAGIELGALGVSATLAYLAGLAMIVLLAGFVSTDRREGYTHLFFSHPTSPLAFYALRWVLAWGLALGAAALFLVLGQLVAWGELRGGWAGLLLPALTATVYGGLMAFLSAALPRGDVWVALVLFLPTFVPQILLPLQLGAPEPLYQLVVFLLPPQPALQTVYQGILTGAPAWGGALFAAGYGAFFLLAAALVLRLREW